MEFVMILSTIGTETDAQTVANKLITSGKVACVNIIPGIQSVYVWKGKQCNESECLLLIKTTKNNEKDVYRLIGDIHPYEIPEIISLPIQNGSKEYLNWIRASVKS